MTDQWFGKTTTGTDAGIVKLLDMGKADIGCCAGITDSNKIDVVDFVVPTYPLRYTPGLSSPKHIFIAVILLECFSSFAIRVCTVP